VASSGAEGQKVCAIRLSGVQNPTPMSHMTIIDHIAITTPPARPPRAPLFSTSSELIIHLHRHELVVTGRIPRPAEEH